MRKRQILIGVAALAVVGLLAGCSGAEATVTVPAGEMPVVAREGEGAVVAEAVIEPDRWSELHFDAAGTLVTMLVQEGDAVTKGDPLARLETEDLARAVTQAELSLRQAQLRLEQLQEPLDEADVEVARAAVSDAAAAYQEAKMNLTVTEHSVSVGDEVRAAARARDEAYRVYQDLVARLGESDRNTALAHDMYLDALGAYNRAVESAELELTAAQNAVTRAYHALEQAQNNLDELLEGADEADVEAARLDVEAAELALDEANSRLEEATLVAPFDGVVAAVSLDSGDAVAPGQVVLVLATLDHLQARTTDLTELDVARVAEGQSATVTVDALPDQEFAGVVREVALRPGDYRGDVVYAVIVELTDVTDAPLRWGMTALVKIRTD
ncbi:MAG: HlyD family secretion protein [Anaerolineae bacterium]